MKILSLATLLSAQTTKFLDRHENDEVFVLSPLDDDALFARVKNHHFLKYEIDTLGYVLALVSARILGDFGEIDEGYLSGESNAGLEEIDELCEFLKDCDGIIVAPENFSGANSANIAYMLNALSKACGFDIIGINGKVFDMSFAPSKMDELELGGDFNGASVFCMSAKSSSLKGSAMFAAASKLKDGANVVVRTKNGEITTTFTLDRTLKGTTGILTAPNLEYQFCRV